MQQIDITLDELEQNGYKLGKLYKCGVEKKTDDTWETRVYKPASDGLMCAAWADKYDYYTKPIYEENDVICLLKSYGVERL